MRILYITPIWTALKEVMETNNKESKGMPGFIKPLQVLIERGNEVEFYFIDIKENIEDINRTNNNSTLIKSSQVAGSKIIKSKRRINKLIYMFFNCFSTRKELSKIIKERKYDFIYCQGDIGYPAEKLARKYNIACGRRQYGTFLTSVLSSHKNSKMRAFMSVPYEVLSYKSKKDFLLTTDDSTKGNEINNIFSKKGLYDFYFWKNGVDRYNIDEKEIRIEKEKLEGISLLYIARICNWKQQHLAVDLLKKLKDKKIIAHLYLVGQISPNEEYYDYIMGKAKENDLCEQIHYLGTKNRYENCLLAKACDYSLSFYSIGNLGNVFHELLCDGARIISLNDGSLDEFIKNGENGYLVNNMEEASIIVQQTCGTNGDEIRQKATETSKEKMISWDERVNMEIDLIEKAVKMHCCSTKKDK